MKYAQSYLYIRFLICLGDPLSRNTAQIYNPFTLYVFRIGNECVKILERELFHFSLYFCILVITEHMNPFREFSKSYIRVAEAYLAKTSYFGLEDFGILCLFIFMYAYCPQLSFLLHSIYTHYSRCKCHVAAVKQLSVLYYRIV